MSTSRRLLKVCCLQSVEEAHVALSGGADLLGFVGDGTGDWGPISISVIASIVAGLPAGARSVLLTSFTRLDAIVDRCREVRPYAVQLTDGFDGDLSRLRRAVGDTRIFFTVHVTGREVIGPALEASNWADAVMLDSGSPRAPEKVLGATGRVHDWSISAEIVRSASCPIFLAGGIRPDNVAAAIHEVSPLGVDVASGVRASGRLDENALREMSLALLASNG